jgi:hypothetical protein
MGGAVGVKSQQNVGSTFAVFVSCCIIETPHPERPGAEFSRRPMKRKRSALTDILLAAHYSVLVVEDNVVNVFESELRRDVGILIVSAAKSSLKTIAKCRLSGLCVQSRTRGY